ncbi:MAG: DUF411 domain-containing protein [Gammaproteobacteria bacterium]|nr:MAG: DUF411 domain-containing protein [Gammaproteobacteria bacterium]
MHTKKVLLTGAWASGIVVTAALAIFFSVGSSAGVEVSVYKSPTCGCCKAWITHMERNGFSVTVNDVNDVMPVKTRNGVPTRLTSCHTALVGGYVVEGHVPAQDIQRLLQERPEIKGLAVPGMVLGSPGMDIPSKDRYQVLSFDKDGNTAVYANH